MKKHLVASLILLVALAVVATACGAPATPTPTPAPTQVATLPPPPTIQPTPIPPTPTRPPTATTVPTTTPLSLDALKNAEYTVQGPASGKAKLDNGVYKEKAANSSAQITVQFNDLTATGDLNGDNVNDAAVILTVQTGGSGTFYYLYGVNNDKGTPKPSAPELLGDRIKLKSLTIQSGEIFANYLSQGPKDPMTNPTVDTTRRYRLQDTLLVSTTPVTPTAVVPTKAPVVATVKPAATATLKAPPLPKGSIAYHKNDSGIDRMLILDLDRNLTTPLIDIGPVMDLTMGGAGTNAHPGSFSPDNTKFAFIQVTSPGGKNNLKVLNFQTGTPTGIFSDDGLSSPVWSPDGSRIAFIRMNTNQAFWTVSVINANGTGGITDIFPNRGGEQMRGGLSWSKLGIFALGMNTTGLNDVFSLFSDGGGLRNLTNNPADDSTPAYSPDGKLIAFTSNRDGRQQIYVMNADGSGVRRVSQSQFNDFSPTWSPDGNWIAFASNRGNSTDIYMMDLQGGNVKALTTGGGTHPTWSH